jgi:hypothetical protein
MSKVICVLALFGVCYFGYQFVNHPESEDIQAVDKVLLVSCGFRIC